MPISLRPKLATDFIEEKYGDVDGMVAEWEARARQSKSFPEPRQRASVYRWLSDGVPTRGDEFVTFCALLDADPLTLFDYERNGYFSNFAKLRHMLQLGLAAAGIYGPLYKVYRPGPIWPANDIARRCYGRDWHGVEFRDSPDWAISDYLLVKAKFREPTNNWPRAVHIAYRRRNSPDTMWRFYGTVISVHGVIELYSEGGAFQTMASADPQAIQFRTYFGGRPVEWRLASLHAFDLETQFPFNDPETVGFEW